MPRKGHDEVVLLTGFPSFRARHVAQAMLEGPGPRAFVHAVVHAKLKDDALAAIDALPPGARSRIHLLEGDAAAMDLGLSGVELRELGREVDRIHHCVQVSYLGADRATAEHVNVGAAREVIEVARVCPHLKCLVVHSSASVSGDRSGLVRESELDCGQRFRNPIEETLAQAERVYRRAMARTKDPLPIAVLRPTMVVGDSATGEVDRLDGPYLLILLMLTAPPDLALPVPGRADVPLNVVPIDFVARAAIAIGRDPRAPGKTFHLVDPTPLPARKLVELVARAGGRRAPSGFLPANIARAILRAPGIERIAKSPRAFLEAMAVPVVYDHANADELLQNTGIACPPLESYIDRLVTHVQRWLEARAERRESELPPDPLA